MFKKLMLFCPTDRAGALVPQFAHVGLDTAALRFSTLGSGLSSGGRSKPASKNVFCGDVLQVGPGSRAKSAAAVHKKNRTNVDDKRGRSLV